jgi:hypothetical protein
MKLLSLRLRFAFVFLSLFLVPSAVVLCQNSQLTPPVKPDVERIVSGEIKTSAFDSNGKFIPDVGLNDVIILENRRLHEPSSVERIPAGVLIFA